MDIKVGDIILVKASGWLGNLISFITKSPYSHATVIYELKPNILILDATWGGTTMRNLDYYDEGYDVFRYKDGLSKIQRIEVQKWCFKHLNIPYDYTQLLSYIKKIMLRRSIYNNPKKYICSEMVDRLYDEALGINLRPDISDGDTTPDDIFKSNLIHKVEQK